jgi:hypothetical protein
MDPRWYSPRLGILSTEQLQTALDRHQLGTLLSAEPVPLGNFRGNVFLTSTQGAFVLPGVPLDPLRFPTERWFMRQLHEQTEDAMQASCRPPLSGLSTQLNTFLRGDDSPNRPCSA